MVYSRQWHSPGSSKASDSTQLAMKRHKLGLDTSDQIAAFVNDFQSSQNICVPRREMDARIISGHLYLRTTDRIFVPSTNIMVTAPPSHHCYLNYCTHLQSIVEGSIDCQLCRLTYDEPHLNCARLKTRPMCPTEFQTYLQKLGQIGAEVVSTIWQNFGKGKINSDRMWYSHFTSTTKDPTPMFHLRTRAIRDEFEQETLRLGQALTHADTLSNIPKTLQRKAEKSRKGTTI